MSYSLTLLGFPVYSVRFLPNSSQILVGGGGGPTKTGVKNLVGLYEIDSNGKLNELSEFLFSNQEDGCMSLCLHPKEKIFIAGVNSPQKEVDAGNNLNARIFLIVKSK